MSLKLYILIMLTICMGVLISPQSLAEKNLEQSLGNSSSLLVMAQPEQTPSCDETILTIMEQIALICEALDKNEVCYGNRQVEAIFHNERLSLDFSDPGDLLALNQVRSLRLSTLDLVNNLWGVAQLRLLMADFRNLQDVKLLLFGDVYVEDTLEEYLTIDVYVTAVSPINLRTTPDLGGLVVTVAQPNQALLAIARNVDASWIQVEDIETGYQGWVFAELIATSDAGQAFSNLQVSDASKPYWQPMQAFVFESGQTASCDNALTDGLLIQTSTGLSRITFLINEVVIDFLPSGNNRHATALLQSNVASGMNINMIDGQAQVTIAGTTYQVLPNTVLNIPLNEDGTPSGTATLQNNTTQSMLEWLTVAIETYNEQITSQSPIQQNIGSASPIGGNNPPPDNSGNNPPPDNSGNNPPPDNSGNNPPPDNSGNNPPPDNSGGGGPPPHAGTPGPPPFVGTPGPPPHAGGGQP